MFTYSIKVVNTFSYFGTLFNFKGKFLKTQKHVEEQGQKALFAFSNTLQNNFLTKKHMLCFDTYVHSILSHACEDRSFHKAL